MVPMTRLQNSWALAKSSWRVLRSDKQLTWFPILSALASIAVAIVIGVLIWATLGKETNVSGHDQYSANVVTYIIGVCAYVALAFVQTYFLAGLCAAADQSLRGVEPSVKSGLQVANTRLHRILPWAILSATVSVILQAIEERFGFLGQIVANLLGAAWNVVTFLAVPIIVFEDLGAIDALKRSGSLFKRTWGENLAAQFGIGMLGLAVMLPAILVGVIGAASGTAVIAVPLIAIAVVWVLAGMAVLAALSGIYRTALYRYAVDGQVPEAFQDVDFSHAFGPKRNRGRSTSGGFGGGFGGFTSSN
jgi:hypothetical protein